METTPAKDIIQMLETTTPYDKDEVYRYLWAEHVKEDVKAHLEDMELQYVAVPEEIKKIVDRYVYEGDYDCNLPYWDNIENLINEIVDIHKFDYFHWETDKNGKTYKLYGGTHSVPILSFTAHKKTKDDNEYYECEIRSTRFHILTHKSFDSIEQAKGELFLLVHSKM